MSDACVRNITENGTATTNLDLSRRAMACRKFRWLPGMLTTGCECSYRLPLIPRTEEK